MEDGLSYPTLPNKNTKTITHVYHVGSGTSPSSCHRPSSLFLYATGSCSVCVRMSLQNRSSPTRVAVAFAPVTSNTPAVTRSPVSVVTTFALATASASSPRSRADSLSRWPGPPYRS